MRISTEPNSGCWIWLGQINQYGYGRIRVRGSRVRKVAHRVSYEDRHGNCIPEKMQLDHLCRVRCCVNPDHLEIVTQQENMNRAYRHDRLHLGRHQCIHGHEMAKNTIVRKDGKIVCRECIRLSRPKWRKAK